MLEVGRICLKTAGREAGRYCVIVKKVDEHFVLVTGPKAATKVKRRKCNIEHLEPLTEKINIHADATDSEVLRAFEEEDVYTKLSIQKPDIAEMKAMKEEKEKRKAAAKPQERKRDEKNEKSSKEEKKDAKKK